MQRFYQVIKQATHMPFANTNLVHFFSNNAAINRGEVNFNFILFFIEAIDFVAAAVCHFELIDFVALR